jgi:hypothetical protein
METLTIQKEIILATQVEAKANGLWITTKQGRYFIRWADCSLRLARATETERTFLEVSPSGYGVHWPLLDEDLAVGPLVKGRKPARVKANA